MTSNDLTVTAENLAEHLRWRLSNANAEFEDLDAAFNTDRDGSTVTVAVDLWDPVTRQRGHQRFTLTVAPAGGSETGGNR